MNAHKLVVDNKKKDGGDLFIEAYRNKGSLNFI